jgi:DNA segregation ATPase FtsK/SpoIIIE-like protein
MFWKKKHPLVNRIHNVLLEKKFEGAWINRIYQEGDILYANIHLPEQKERADLEKILPNLQQEVSATAVKIGKVSGKHFEIMFGMKELAEIDFDVSMLIEDSLKLRFPSAFGEEIIDFEDGASCHMLNGGVTRMGKTCFLLYLATSIFMQNKGNVGLYITSAKLKDYYPFENIPQVKMSRDMDGMEKMLEEIIDEYKKRDTLLYSPDFQKATDAKSVRKLYPSSYHLFKPIFLIIDEYARFAESKNIQQMVTEIVETAGFVNIHVIIASQRPDAATVLRPRIRANLLCRMAFTTADRKNSEVILDREGAEKLGKIAGRGMLNDGDIDVIQVPFLDAVKCDELLEPYRKEVVHDEQNTEGYIDSEVIEPLQSLISESTGLSNMLGELKSNKRSE